MYRYSSYFYEIIYLLCISYILIYRYAYRYEPRMSTLNWICRKIHYNVTDNDGASGTHMTRVTTLRYVNIIPYRRKDNNEDK